MDQAPEDRLKGQGEGDRRALGAAYVREGRMHAQQVEARDAWYRDLMARREGLRRGMV